MFGVSYRCCTSSSGQSVYVVPLYSLETLPYVLGHVQTLLTQVSASCPWLLPRSKCLVYPTAVVQASVACAFKMEEMKL
jgi:hypothetical protein